MSEIRECSTDGCEAFACHGETKCQSCLHDEHRAKQAAPRAPLAVGEAIDLLSLAARSSTWQGADPRLARALLEVLRSETEACFRAQINRDHMRNERDEARAEVERLTAEVASLREGHVYVCSDCLEDQCECGTAQELAEAAHWLSTRAADPKPTPPVDVPNIGQPDLGWGEVCHDCEELTCECSERNRHVEQPMPTGNGVEVFRVAIADCPSVSLAEALKAREAIGIERYGTTLRTHNGRDVVRDLREELADAYVYATQAGMEAGEPPPDHLLSSVHWALVEAWRALEEHERRRRLEVP